MAQLWTLQLDAILDYKKYSFVHPNLDSWAVKSSNWWWWWCNKGDHFSQFTNIGDNIQDKDNKKDGSSIFGLCQMAGKSKGPEKVRERENQLCNSQCIMGSRIRLSQWFKCYYPRQSKWAHHNSGLNSLPKVTLVNKFLIRNSS